jgi:hypothetical protein
MKSREVQVRRTTLADPGAEQFDREFWARIEPRERLALVWEMVLEHHAWRHPDAPEPRLQRSVCRVER